MIPRILVVDDDAGVCRIAHRMLSDEQYQVQTSQSVADALGAIEQKPFDVYVMDYKLPDGSGLDVAERIRSKGGAAPIILMSGYDRSTVGLRAEKLCITDFLEKPFSREVICTAVKKAIGATPEATVSADGIRTKDVSLSGARSSTGTFTIFRNLSFSAKRAPELTFESSGDTRPDSALDVR
jgi:DNA-binding NtrC family response regulator